MKNLLDTVQKLIQPYLTLNLIQKDGLKSCIKVEGEDTFLEITILATSPVIECLKESFCDYYGSFRGYEVDIEYYNSSSSSMSEMMKVTINSHNKYHRGGEILC